MIDGRALPEFSSQFCLSAPRPTLPSRPLTGPLGKQHDRGDDPDDDGRVDRRQEERRAKEAPQRHALVDQVREHEREDHLDRDRDREDRVVANRDPEDRVVQELLEVGQPDPARRIEPVPDRERVVDDAPERVADEDDDDGDRRRGVDEPPPASTPVGLDDSGRSAPRRRASRRCHAALHAHPRAAGSTSRSSRARPASAGPTASAPARARARGRGRARRRSESPCRARGSPDLRPAR